MRIAQIAPLHERVPPKLYGGTERVVSYLTEELVAQGHEVTLFASGDSITSARLVAGCRSALRLDPACQDRLPYHLVMLEQVYRQAERFDILHFHLDYLHYPLSRLHGMPNVTTLHGRLDLPDLVPLYREYSDMPLVSISDAQREPLAWASWLSTVHHGLPLDRYPFQTGSGGYLAFLGRVSPEKGADRAIEIAQRAGMPLKIAAKVDAADRSYFDERIRPLLDTPGVEFIGEIGDDDKPGFLGRAVALLFPIDWPEPFGLAMVESMAFGTPVIAWRGGSVSEIMVDGTTGFVVESLEDAVRAVHRVGQLDRAGCRAACEKRFSVSRMARDYLEIYERLLRGHRGPKPEIRPDPQARPPSTPLPRGLAT